MAFQVSAGVLVQEKDLTRIIPGVSTSIGAVAGQFNKGPLDEVVAISSEQELVDTFGKPDSSTFEYFFTAANFLQYSNALRVVRASNTGSTNANASGSSAQVKNIDDYHYFHDAIHDNQLVFNTLIKSNMNRIIERVRNDFFSSSSAYLMENMKYIWFIICI